MNHELPPQPELETEQERLTCEQDLGQAAIELVKIVEPAKKHYRSYDFEGPDDRLAKALGL